MAKEMSRELKFRIYDKTSGYYVAILDNDCFDIKQVARIILELEMLKHEYIIDQYTGLLDKNGKEIYENDIVKCYSTAEEPCLSVVTYGRMPDIKDHEYCPCRIGFYLDDKVYFDEDFGEDDDHGELEIIGNIHENPELLGGK